MGCIQGKKQNGNLQKSRKYQFDKSKGGKENGNVPSTPTFNLNLEFELTDGNDLNNYPTFRKALKIIEKEEQNDIKRRSQSENLVLYEINNNTQLEQIFQDQRMTYSANTARKINFPVYLDDINLSSIIKRRRKMNEFQYQM